jgi:hypothetical protein
MRKKRKPRCKSIFPQPVRKSGQIVKAECNSAKQLSIVVLSSMQSRHPPSPHQTQWMHVDPCFVPLTKTTPKNCPALFRKDGKLLIIVFKWIRHCVVDRKD